MSRRLSVSPVVIAAVVVLAGLFFKHQIGQRLEDARAAVVSANIRAKESRAIAAAESHRANVATARADSAEWHAAQSARQARAATERIAQRRPAVEAAVLAAPDTCAPALAVVLQDRDDALHAAYTWQAAYDSLAVANTSLRVANTELQHANARLNASLATLGDASNTLVKRSREPFLARLTPDLGVGGAIGVDPVAPEQGVKKVVGLTLSWKF